MRREGNRKIIVEPIAEHGPGSDAVFNQMTCSRDLAPKLPGKGVPRSTAPSLGEPVGSSPTAPR